MLIDMKAMDSDDEVYTTRRIQRVSKGSLYISFPISYGFKAGDLVEIKFVRRKSDDKTEYAFTKRLTNISRNPGIVIPPGIIEMGAEVNVYIRLLKRADSRNLNE